MEGEADDAEDAPRWNRGIALLLLALAVGLVLAVVLAGAAARAGELVSDLGGWLGDALVNSDG